MRRGSHLGTLVWKPKRTHPANSVTNLMKFSHKQTRDQWTSECSATNKVLWTSSPSHLVPAGQLPQVTLVTKMGHEAFFVASLAHIWEQNGRTCASNASAGDKVNSWMIAIHIIQIPRTGWTWSFLDLLNALREWPTACAASTNATWRCCKQRHARVFAILVLSKSPIPNGLICWATFKLFLNTLPFNLSHHINKLLSPCQHESSVSILYQELRHVTCTEWLVARFTKNHKTCQNSKIWSPFLQKSGFWLTPSPVSHQEKYKNNI